ncbi:mRNA splicing protein YJU2 NDAI_0K02160 [Naumovozyma dairenensis CBS 421]|uniref:Splicing factor YJU2 n=1 Tax=Naumovozyma dairenensis (strain ATCC 10597 / BCRC 20456 / CBS 421 / NBRC 0211 / NRRL Y-12639) TaxID=1071378 RepID=G0WHZ6_NAUDC|nr:hypothetical protein NDAI_0K02160 [Naumovozyma dairenensis CBS 421]CCD27407.1 hypothetical protein NDAI_0K02160 [Naumovozyma dairenensis CBS 421]
MSERKAINKYYPPDYDPILAEKSMRKNAKQLKTMDKGKTTIRLMTPFSMRCLKCSEFIPKSRKFNGKKELLPERYLESVKIYRLTIRCPRCANMISFKTDPRNGDYIMEEGATKNHISTPAADAVTDHGETIDDSITRLLLQQEQEDNDKDGLKETKQDKMELLTNKLMKLQREKEDDEILTKIHASNLERFKKSKEISNNAKVVAASQSEKSLEKEVDEIFAKHKKLASKNIVTDTSDRKLIPHVSKLIQSHGKESIKFKKKNTKKLVSY